MDDFYPKGLGQAIKRLIDNNGMRLSSFVEKIGVTAETVDHWISGTEIPTMSELASIAQALNIDMDRLIRLSSQKYDTSPTTAMADSTQNKQTQSTDQSKVLEIFKLQYAKLLGRYEEARKMNDDYLERIESLLKEIKDNRHN